MTNIRRKFKQQLEQKLDRPTIVPGVLGNGTGRVVVPGRSNFAYVRLAGGIVTEVFNVRVRAQYDLPVICGYDPLDPSRFQVLSIMGSSAEAAKFVMEGGYAPASRYRWMYPGGGQDPLFVEGPQIMPGRIIPAGGLKINVYPLVVWTGSGWSALGGSTEIDLTTSVPETEGQARFVLVTISSSGIVSTAGTAVALADLGLDDLPDAPSGTLYVLGAVRLYHGQTVIQEGRSETDVMDLRWPMRHEHDGAYEASQVITDTEKIQIISNEFKMRGDLDATAVIRFFEITDPDGDKRVGSIYSDWGGAAEHDGMLWLTAKRDADSPWDAAGITLNASDTETGKYARIWLRSDGQIKIYGPVNVLDGIIWGGWQPDSDVWKYVSATQFKIEGKNVASRFPAGTKIKLTQSSLKYFYATSASYSDGNTIVTVTGGSDYSLANATIKSPHYSYASTPQGFPQWFNYTPTIIAGFSSPPTLSNCYFCITGRLCYYRFHCSNTGTSNSNLFQVSAPVNAGGEYNGTTCYAVDNGVAQTSPGLLTIFSGYNTVTIYKNLAAAGWTASGEKRATFVIAYPVG